jgi:hypothetical protein
MNLRANGQNLQAPNKIVHIIANPCLNWQNLHAAPKPDKSRHIFANPCLNWQNQQAAANTEEHRTHTGHIPDTYRTFSGHIPDTQRTFSGQISEMCPPKMSPSRRGELHKPDKSRQISRI